MVKKYISTKPDTITVDKSSIVTGTFTIAEAATTDYLLNTITAQLIWIKKPSLDSVYVEYRVFPYKLNRTVQYYNFDSIKNNFLVTPYSPKLNETSSKLIDLGNIEYTGSFGRSLSFGNAQDAVLNSNLNLQLSGMLADSIEIAASLTDQNLPIQPDGSTTQLNEIDRIFIQFKKRNWNLNLGDIDLRQNSQYYLNFYKRLQGLSFESTNSIGKKSSNNILISGALARGKFTTNIFQGQEANQGPYRLQGANNEFFFIILAGTERVFIDGELLQRGEDQDYIINYNTAEITFTPQRLINKDKRIRVEFEYSDRNYVNSQLYVSNEFVATKKLKIKLSAYSNTDAKNSPINQQLNPLQKQFLVNIGDSTQNAFFPTATNDTLTAGKILYRQKDTIVNSILYRVYVYSTNPADAKFNLTFTSVGIAKGNYVELLNGANGKAFKWVAPIAGIKQGSFEPVQYLVTPRKQQILSITTQYQIDSKNKIDLELATSKNDVNTFAEKDKNNDVGYASKINWNNVSSISKKSKLLTNFAYEYNNFRFRTIERLRTPEFNRDWNLPFITQFYNEQLGNIDLQLSNEKNNQIKFQFNNYFRGNGYKGYRQSINTQHTFKGWKLNSNTSYTNTTDSFQKGLFFRPTVDIFKTMSKWKNIKIGFNYFLEHNELLNKVADTLNPLSISFDSYKLYVQNDMNKQNKWSLAFTKRNNRIPIGKKLVKSDVANDLEAGLQLLENPRHLLSFKAVYRNLDVSLPAKVTYKSDETLLGRVEYSINEWKGLVQGNLLYENGSGQEQKRDFAFLQVPTGQGEYFWIDYNNDGTQQLNEFELALFPDQRQFIKIFVPTNQFIKANFNTFNYSISINPRAKMLKQKYKGFKYIISRSFFQSTIQIQKKEQSQQLINPNVFKYSNTDTSLISLNRIISNSFSFNKFSTVWGIDINQDFRVNRFLLTYGYETRDVNSYTIKGRLNIKNKFLLESINKKINNKLITPSFNNRNFAINQLGSELKINYTYKTKLRTGTSILYETKNNSALYGGEKAITQSLSFNAKYNALQNAALEAKFTYTNIVYTGLPNTTTSFIMLDALVPGKNFLWNIDLIKTLKNNLEITFRYEGRKTGTARPIHIGSATMRANFY